MQNTSKTSTFDFNALIEGVTTSHKVRVVTIDSKPWFLGIDVCKVLGITAPHYAYDRLDKDEVSYVGRTHIGLHAGKPMALLSEPGLYRLLMRSDKPVAKPFQDWLAKTVLPAIRQDGGYISGEEKVSTGEMTEDELVLKALTVLQTKVERLSAENAVMKSELNTLTVDEYRSLNHQYWEHRMRVMVGSLASNLCKARGIEIGKQSRVLKMRGTDIPTILNVYPRHILAEAASEARRRLHH
jgi:prophage antirepressor-like protein